MRVTSPSRRAAPRCARRHNRATPSIASVCAPSAGTGSMRGSPSSHDPGGSSAGTRPADVSTSRQRLRARSCGCSQTSCIVLTRALAICASSRRSTTCSAVSVENASTMMARNSTRAALRLELVEKRSSLGQRRLAQHLLAERRPFALVLQAQHDHLAVACGERTVRIDGGVAGSCARRRRRAVHRVVQRVVHPLDQRFQHRDVDVLAAARSAAGASARRGYSNTRTCRRRCRRWTGPAFDGSSSVPVIDTRPDSLWISRS